MKVILLKDVRGVGRHGEVKTVADGYAINALFPKQLAEPATEERIKDIELRIKAEQAQKEKEEAQLDNTVASLRGKAVTIAARATEKGGLFKTLHESDIARAIREQHSLDIPESAVRFAAPIKTIGEHVVQLASTHNKAELKVVITPVP